MAEKRKSSEKSNIGKKLALGFWLDLPELS